MLNRTYFCVVSAGLVLTLSSFSCVKDAEVAGSIEEEMNDITIDFRQFPAHTEFILIGDNGQGEFRFNSDSLRLYELQIPGGTYNVRWKVNTTSDAMYKAKWLNSSAGTSVPWETATYTYGHRYMRGTYTFTKERK